MGTRLKVVRTSMGTRLGLVRTQPAWGWWMVTIVWIAGLFLVLSACASASNCAGWSPIRLSKSDRLTQLTETQVLEHNRQGEKQGCWKAK